jgi:hypothetical protein
MDVGAPNQPLDTTSSDTLRSKRRATESKVVVLELAQRIGSVSQACRIMGYSRDSFYRFKKLYEAGGESALQGISRRKPILKNRVAPEIEEAVLKLALEEPTWGQARVASVLTARGLQISAAGVRCVWVRHQLQTTQFRLKALEAQTGRPSRIEPPPRNENDTAIDPTHR